MYVHQLRLCSVRLTRQTKLISCVVGGDSSAESVLATPVRLGIGTIHITPLHPSGHKRSISVFDDGVGEGLGLVGVFLQELFVAAD